MKMVGNTRLVEYGIQTEESDIRIHVGVYARAIYMYKTKDGQQAIAEGDFRKVPVRTNGIVTAEGLLVPPDCIPGCLPIPIPGDIFEVSKIGTYPEYGFQGPKGKAAVCVVKEMLQQGMIPINLKITEIDDKTMQIKGEDINVKANIKIQVKYDYKCGVGHPRCTGNLFIQTAECNPFGIY